MQKTCSAAFLAVLLVAGFLPAAEAQSPIAKVLQLITDLQAKIVKEGEEAHKVFEEFSEWCEERSRNVGFEIKTGKSEIGDLKAAIDKSKAEVEVAHSEIERIGAEISTDEADLKAATTIRAKETEDFALDEKELVDTIDTIERAIMILEREMKKGTPAMLQLQHTSDLVHALDVLVDASVLGSQDAKKLTALVQSAQQDGDDEFAPPAAAAYESRSGNIVETLEDLLDKAKDQLDSARRKETASKHNFEMLEQSLKDEIKFAEKELADNKKALATSSEAKANAEGELEVTQKALAEDIETKSTLHQDCLEKAQDYEAATKSRSEELKALAEAKNVIKEKTGGADALTYSTSEAAFLQIAAEGSRMKSEEDLANFEAVQLVRNLARREHSKRLALLAKRMAAVMRESASSGQDPFGKVKALIRDMIEKLMAEMGAEAKQKAYCDKEMSETAAKLAEKNAVVDKLSTQIDSMTARSAQLKTDVADLQKALADLASAQASMDKIRSEEREAYAANKVDMEQGLEGVKMALKILRDYYAQEGAAHATAEGASTGIIGMLEVVESDLTRGLAEMTIEEQAAETEYQKMTREGAISKATKESSVKYKTKEYKSLDTRVAEASSDRETTHTELMAVQEYDAKIKDMCVAKPESYAERSARREAEIAGLKEALQILNGETVLLQGRAALRGIRRARGA